MAKYKTKIIEFRLRSRTALDEFYCLVEHAFTNVCYDPSEYVKLVDGGRIYRVGPLKFFAVISSRRDYEKVEELISELAQYSRSVLAI